MTRQVKTGPPLTIDINYKLNAPHKSVVRTNIKQETLSDVIGDYLLGQIGMGVDKRKPIQRKVYRIVITLDLSSDTFRTRSNTGNAGLTTGLVMAIRDRLDRLKVLPLGVKSA